MTQTKTFFAQITVLFSILVLCFYAAAFTANAAQYAYIDVDGKLQTVTAQDWMSAIATAPNIHINSGVYLLSEGSSI